MNLDTHYKVLGLAPGSPLATVKRAYLREIKIWHPDRYSPESVLRGKAEERTKALTAAYAALTTALKASAETPRGESRPQQQEPPQSPPQSEAAPSTGEWIGRVWRRLKGQWKQGPASPAANAAAQSRRRRKPPKHRPKPSPPPRFEDVLQAARNHPRVPTDISVVWRRLTARRARYGGRRGSGAAAIKPIRPRGPVHPVDPVDRIHPIGKDG